MACVGSCVSPGRPPSASSQLGPYGSGCRCVSGGLIRAKGFHTHFRQFRPLLDHVTITLTSQARAARRGQGSRRRNPARLLLRLRHHLEVRRRLPDLQHHDRQVARDAELAPPQVKCRCLGPARRTGSPPSSGVDSLHDTCAVTINDRPTDRPTVGAERAATQDTVCSPAPRRTSSVFACDLCE